MGLISACASFQTELRTFTYLVKVMCAIPLARACTSTYGRVCVCVTLNKYHTWGHSSWWAPMLSVTDHFCCCCCCCRCFYRRTACSLSSHVVPVRWCCLSSRPALASVERNWTVRRQGVTNGMVLRCRCVIWDNVLIISMSSNLLSSLSITALLQAPLPTATAAIIPVMSIAISCQ